MSDIIEKGFTLWFTGLPCSGKTTLAKMAEKEIRKRGFKVELLDGGLIRKDLNKDLGFDKQDRDINISRIGYVCNLLSKNGIVAIAAAISPYRAQRDENRRVIGSFVEVYVKCPLEICIKRDKKGLYKSALEGKIRYYTGVTDPYEEPFAPEVIVETDKETEEESLSKIINKLAELGYLPKRPEKTRECAPQEDIYSVEDEAKIKKRLEELGYI